MMIWITSARAFSFFVFVFCVPNSATNVEIELQSLIANKMGTFLAIVMKITFHRKEIAIVSWKTSNFAKKKKASWLNHK